MNVLLVAVGGAVGALLRYLTDSLMRRKITSAFPFGTLTVNVAGTAILGLLAGFALYGAEPTFVRTLVGVGLCGALTTFSAFGYETVALFTARARWYAVLNAAGTILACFGAALLGVLIAGLLVS